ncbi:DUF1398 family protein [Iodobacter sp. BJB302]|uniref:DUF1398 family protein n=1 Tax=Iodobacter sp. BJB302 TaxID=1506510 RepID=UPI000C113596|nr:DUF1398 family protein [Iodobacter sp. BJB302]PHU99498.1 DUF1398 domain-containing protein [Iodobacter sp. BJB302]
MNADIITSTAHASHANKISFPEYVGKLIEAGVEYYHVNYVTLQISFYSSEGSVVSLPVQFESLPAVSADFDVQSLRAAILESQNNSQPYRKFSERAMKSGVQSYFAFLRGKRVTYIGRQGEQHTEWFPCANAKST